MLGTEARIGRLVVPLVARWHIASARPIVIVAIQPILRPLPLRLLLFLLLLRSDVPPSAALRSVSQVDKRATHARVELFSILVADLAAALPSPVLPPVLVARIDVGTDDAVVELGARDVAKAGERVVV